MSARGEIKRDLMAQKTRGVHCSPEGADALLDAYRAEVLNEAADAIQNMERRNAWAVRPMTSSLYAEFLRGLSGGTRDDSPTTSTPCGPNPDVCDAEAGDPCRTHEREQAHGEGEHAFCGPECSGTGGA